MSASAFRQSALRTLPVSVAAASVVICLLWPGGPAGMSEVRRAGDMGLLEPLALAAMATILVLATAVRPLPHLRNADAFALVLLLVAAAAEHAGSTELGAVAGFSALAYLGGRCVQRLAHGPDPEACMPAYEWLMRRRRINARRGLLAIAGLLLAVGGTTALTASGHPLAALLSVITAATLTLRGGGSDGLRACVAWLCLAPVLLLISPDPVPTAAAGVLIAIAIVALGARASASADPAALGAATAACLVAVAALTGDWALTHSAWIFPALLPGLFASTLDGERPAREWLIVSRRHSRWEPGSPAGG